jgi:hypothetical protein
MPPFRKWPPRWKVITAAVAVTALTVVTVVDAAGHHARPKPPASAPGQAPVLVTATPSSGGPVPAHAQAAAAVGTALVGCDAVSWWRLGSGWQAYAVRAGPLWLLDARRLGYARTATRDPGPSRSAAPPRGQARNWTMTVHIDGGARVVMRAAAETSAYFHFIDGPASATYGKADDVPGLTFTACGNTAVEPAWVSLYQLTFSIVPGQTARVEVLTATSAAPLWISFTTPG